MMKKFGFGLAVIAILFGLYAWFSPLTAFNGLRNAVVRKDTITIKRYVDFPQVKESLKTSLNTVLLEQSKKDESGFGALGMLFASSMIDPMVDTIVTPEGLASIGANTDFTNGNVDDAKKWQMHRKGFSYVLIGAKDAPNSGLVMERKGLGWQVTSVQIDTTALTN